MCPVLTGPHSPVSFKQSKQCRLYSQYGFDDTRQEEVQWGSMAPITGTANGTCDTYVSGLCVKEFADFLKPGVPQKPSAAVRGTGPCVSLSATPRTVLSR